MNKLLMCAGVALISLTLSGISNVANAKERTAQQQRMADCAHSGKGMKGDTFKSHMKSCLSGKTEPTSAAAGAAAAAPVAVKADEKVANKNAQKQKMKSCNAEAKTKELKGSDRKSFMKSCLSAPA